MVNGMIDPLSLVDSAQPASIQDHDVEEPSFCDFCMVCDKLISEKVKGNVSVTPVEDEEKPKKPKKKAAGGKVYIKNPDGTILTKTANGTKVTRPALKRNPSSANRLAVVAADHGSKMKVQPLTRSKTMDPTPTQEPVIPRTSSSSTSNSPQSTKTNPSPAQPSRPLQDEYRSNLYCSLDCELQEKGASSATYKQIARSLSYDLGLNSKDTLERLLMSGLPDQSQYAPPSPLFISGSDTSSNAGQDGPACSAPNTLGFFKLSREGPDEAWNNVQRQRRSSMAQPVRPASLARHRSNTSTNPGWGDVSSDSLSSMWNTNGSEQDLDLSRSTSNGPKARVSFAAETDRANLWAQRRSMSHTSQRTAPLAMAKPALNRSSLSTTSLTVSPGRDGVAARDSVSKDTVELLHSYNAAFPVRESASNSYKQKGFVLARSPGSTPNSRRASMSANIQRNGTGTIRVKKTSEPTWDSFGRQEIEERQIARAMRRASSQEREENQTPKQTLAKVDGKWTVVYGETSPRPALHRTVSRGSDASRRSSESRSTLEHRSPRPAFGTSLSSNHGRTPVTSAMAPPAAIPVRQRRDGSMTPSSSLPSRAGSTVTIPDLASLRIGSAGCIPFLGKAPAVNRGFDWTAHEQQGGKTYALPPNINVDRSKAGLFYFQN